MQSTPLILVSPSTDEKGAEFYDYSISLSQTYLDAITQAGGLPLVLPCAPSPKLVAEYVRRADGVQRAGEIGLPLAGGRIPHRFRGAHSRGIETADRRHVARHAAAANCRVLLTSEPDALRLEVHDDGRGFDPSRSSDGGHHGLANMRSRIVSTIACG